MEIRKATKADIPQIVKTLQGAFINDPIFDWFLRDDDKRPAALGKMFNAIIDLLGFDDCEILLINDGAGVAVMVPYPGELEPTLAKEIRALPALFGASGLKRLDRMIRMRTTIKRYKEKSPHEYLWFLGVAPELQGKGLGGKLLDEWLRAIDARNITAALETATQSNVAFYQSRGFEIVHEFQIDNSAPKVWTMRRPIKKDL